MCYDRNASPPLLAGPRAVGASGRLVLESSDGTRFGAFEAAPDGDAQATVLILPDVRGLHPYYEELACRFAEHGYRALAIDYFGRTVGATLDRPPGFEYHEHVDATTLAGLTADVLAGAAYLRESSAQATERLFTIGFCFGGRLSFLAATLGLDIAGSIGVHPGLHARNDMPAPVDFAADVRAPLLGLFGGADSSIPPEAIAEFDTALTAAGVEHRFVTFDGAPHSFFDRKFTEFAEQNAAAWQEVLSFVGRGERVPA
ncbi:MAG TPA: dienelactone hydrolase family protein [Candidatus Limnocylindrales bacterium]|nr:dienelactone hydrolase family protein [Candidatus Limnocylindrales bacterium]